MVMIAPGAEMPRINLNHHTMVLETTKDNDDFFDNFQDKLRGFFPKKNPASLSVIILIIISIWALSGFYRVGTDEQGVVTRFGEYVRTTEPGLHYHLPFPIEKASKPKVTRVNRIEVGFRNISITIQSKPTNSTSS